MERGFQAIIEDVGVQILSPVSSLAGTMRGEFHREARSFEEADSELWLILRAKRWPHSTVTVQRKLATTVQIGDRSYQTWDWSAKARSSYRTIPPPEMTIEQLQKQQVRQGASPFVFIDQQRLAAMQRHISNGRLPAKFELIPNLLRDFKVIQGHAAKGSQWASGCIHDLRRTYCTWIADVVPMHVLREWAGHSDIATTATFYLGVNDGMADRARRALAAAI